MEVGYTWENVIVRHNVFINQESQGFFASTQHWKSFAIVGNLVVRGGTDQYYGFHHLGGTITDLFCYHNTFVAAYAGIRITSPMVSGYIVNNLFSSDASTAYGSNFVDYNATPDGSTPGVHSVRITPSTLSVPLYIPGVAYEGLSSGYDIPFCDRAFGSLPYHNPTQIGWINVL